MRRASALAMRLKVAFARATTTGGIVRAGYVRAADRYASNEVGPSWLATSPGESPASPPDLGTKPSPPEPDDLPVIKTRNRASAPASKKNDAVRTLVRVLVTTTPPHGVRR